MLRKKVTGRNKGLHCRRCDRKLGDVGKHAFVTHRYGGSRGEYCDECGKKLQDSTAMRKMNKRVLV